MEQRKINQKWHGFEVKAILFFQTVLVYVGDPRVSAGSSSPHPNSSFIRSNRHSRSAETPTASAVVLRGGPTSGGRLANHHEPYFAEGASGETRNMSAQLGTTTYLHCKVNSLGGKTVIQFPFVIFILRTLLQGTVGIFDS